MSLFRKGLHIAGRQLIIIAGVIAALILLLIGSGAWLSSAVAERKDEIARWAGERTGYQIEIGEAGLYWLDLLPKLMLADVNVLTPRSQRPVLQLANLYVGVDLLASLSQRQAVINNASVTGLRLGVMRDATGQFSVRDLNWQSDDETAGDNQWQAVLAGLQHLQLQDIDLDYQDAYQPSLSGHYQLHRATLTQSGEWLAADMRLSLPQHLGQQLTISGRLLRDDQDWPEWQLSLDGSQLQLATLLDGHQLRGVSADQGRADIRVTASKQAGETNADGLLRLQNSRFIRPGEAADDASSPGLMVDYLNTEFNWLQQGERWQLDLQSLDLVMNGEAWPQAALRASFDPAAGAQLQSNYLRLSDLSAIAALIDDAPDWLKNHAPAGDVSDLQLRVDENQQIQQLQATVSELGFQESGDIPGMTGLSFHLDWTGEQAVAQINSRELAVYARNWLAETLYFDSLNGSLRWQPDTAGGKLSLDGLQLVNADLNVRINGSVDTADTGNTDITLNLADFNVANWLTYVPERVIEPEFLNWARDAFIAGQVDQGEIRFQGEPAAFPFDEQPDAGSFDMQLSVSNVGLKYGDDWPNLESVNGQVSGSGNDLQITTDSGRIAGFEFAGVNASISNLIKGQPTLTLDGRIQGEARQGLLFLKNSPLASRFGPVADWLTIGGDALITLDLLVPLLDPDATLVEGEINLQDNNLKISELPALVFEQLGGTVVFNNDALTAEKLNAEIAGEKAVIIIQPESGKTQVRINTAFDVDRMAGLWQLDLPDGLSGRSNLQADINVAETQPGDFSVEVLLNSDLQGISIDLPAPFNKPATSNLPLQVKLVPDEALRIDVQLSDWMNANAELADADIRAGIALGQQRASIPASGISLTGKLASLSVSDWQRWWQQNAGQQSDTAWQIDTADLRFDLLEWNALELTDVSVSVRRQPAVWQIQLVAEQLNGDINWPVSGDSLPTLDFDFVNLALPGDVIGAADKPRAPDLWPGFQLNINSLTLDDMKLGRLQARAERDALRWQLVSATLESPTLQASASGDWRRTDDGDNSQLNLQLNSDDLAGLLVDLGYQPAISARRVNVNGDFSWSDAPLNFSRRNLRGHMQLDVGNGELTDVEPGAAGRIFGLLSFTAIPRRLALDFKDLFGSGFGFSSIKGRFDFENGLATTNNLQMRGDSALIGVSGPINLLDRTYNQTVQVTPSVSSTLPLAGAVAGGPIGLGVGTAIFLADKLVSNLFDREIVNIITYRYQLTGPWDAPEMKLRTAEQP